MDSFFAHFATVFMGFFAIMNPIANTPIFMGLTAEDELKVKKQVAWRAVLLAFIIILAFSLLGKLIFTMFGISLPAFRVTGGILVLMIGFNMLQGEQSKVHSPSEDDNKKSIDSELSVAISPLAIPILAGPGTIATAMNFSADGKIEELSITIISFAILCVITYLSFIFGQKFIKFIGDSAIKVITRLMGLILAVIGMQMIIEGIYGAIRMFNKN